MKMNGSGIYGSKAWVKLGEGRLDADGNLRTLPSGQLGKDQADFQFGPSDFRFTAGAHGEVYAFALAAPAPNSSVKIVSFGASAHLLAQPIRSVTLLGSNAKLNWTQRPDGLVIRCPTHLPSHIVTTFKIE
jgi:alpha-L-fucosidase